MTQTETQRVLLGCLLSFLVVESSLLTPTTPGIRYIGRHHLNSTMARFDWVGTGLAFQLADTMPPNENVSVVLDGGGHVRWAVYRNNDWAGEFFSAVGDGRKTYPLTHASGGDVVTLIKATEWYSSQKPVQVYGLEVPFPAELQKMPTPERRLDIYGDSDTSAYGLLGTASSPVACSLNPVTYQDFNYGWVSDVERALGMDIGAGSVQAVSGIGCYKNCCEDGGTTLPQMVRRTLQTVAIDDFATSPLQPPSAVVIYLGGNDFTLNFQNPTESQFMGAYEKMMKDIKSFYPSAHSLPFVHACGHSIDGPPCSWLKALANTTENNFYTTTGDHGVSPGGCVGHRNVPQQEKLANFLAPVIKTAAGW